VVPFNSMLHSSQSLNILYDWNDNVVLGIALVITVHALNPSSVVNKNVSKGLLIRMFNRFGWSLISII